MRKLWIVPVLMTLFLAGCRAEETFETVEDAYIQQTAAIAREILVSLPETAVAPAVESDAGTVYQCDGYEIILQTMAGGDMDETIRLISGYERSALTVMYTSLSDIDRYSLVWACMGEEGERIGKAVILDDGSYHYALTVLADADRTEEYNEVWEQVFDSFCLA